MSSVHQKVTNILVYVKPRQGHLHKLRLPKSVLPPAGSFLAELFAGLPLQVQSGTSLPIETFARLQTAGRLTRVDRQLLGVARFLRGLRARVTGR